MRLSTTLLDKVSSITVGSLLLTCSCSSSTEGSADSDTTVTVCANEWPDSISPFDAGTETIRESVYHASNDIAMRVRSVASALNEGEAIDSVDYNFSGVLTDGMGAPLYTDFEGFPGQWEVDVISSKEVKIRNIGIGDLAPASLMEYVAGTINASSDTGEAPEMTIVESYDSGDAQIAVYQYGHTSVQVETRPEMLPTGEVGPQLEITLRYDTVPTGG